jgi:hypothetical protein
VAEPISVPETAPESFSEPCVRRRIGETPTRRRRCIRLSVASRVSFYDAFNRLTDAGWRISNTQRKVYFDHQKNLGWEFKDFVKVRTHTWCESSDITEWCDFIRISLIFSNRHCWR